MKTKLFLTILFAGILVCISVNLQAQSLLKSSIQDDPLRDYLEHSTIRLRAESTCLWDEMIDDGLLSTNRVQVGTPNSSITGATGSELFVCNAAGGTSAYSYGAFLMDNTNNYFVMSKEGTDKKNQIMFRIENTGYWFMGMTDNDDDGAGTGEEFFIGQTSGGTNAALFITGQDRIGIGTNDPGDAKLRVYGKFTANGYSTGDMVDIVNNQADLPADADLIWGSYAYSSQSNNPRLLNLTHNGAHKFVVRNNGQVGVNCDPGNSEYMLSVNGKVICEKVKVISDVSADYVFAPEYKLKSLDELETFIKSNKHLPDVPSEQEVKENGMDLGEMNVLLLEKVEELTLHIIDLNKRIRELENEANKK